jgi:hypothetical protein
MFTCFERPRPLLALIAALALGAVPTAAKAVAKLAWVSSSGQNSGSCGAIRSPCQTLQYAHDVAVLAGGVIAIRDSGAFGPLTIAKAVNIVNDGAGTAMIVNTTAGGTAITVKAGVNDKVVLRGLTVEGGGSGQTGVAFVSGASLSIEKCSVRNFAVTGIALGPIHKAAMVVSDTVSENNGAYGIYIQPRTQTETIFHASLLRVQTNNNSGHGIGVYGNFSPNARVIATITDSASLNNHGVGYHMLGGNIGDVNVKTLLIRSSAHGNADNSAVGAAGAIIEDHAELIASESILLHNYGEDWQTKGALGRVQSYLDNVANRAIGRVYFLEKR